MEFAFDQEQDFLREAVRGALEREAPVPQVREWSEAGDFSAFTAVARAQGWSGIGIAEEREGQGGGLVEQAILFEELGRAAAPSGGLLASALAAALRPGEPIDDDRQVAVVWPAERPLDALAGWTPSVAGESLSGRVELVLDAPAADFLLVPVAAGGEISLWTVEPRTGGVAVQERQLIDRTRRFADVTLDGAIGQRTGSIDESMLSAATARVAVLLSAESLGLARRMLEMTVAYVREREQFGKPVGSFQAVKHAAAQALVDIEAAHSGVYFAAWAVENHWSNGPLHAWIAKSFACDMGATIADVSLQLHGAIGYTWEYDLHIFFKRAMANRELLGSARGYRDRVADELALA
jgi:alkylation response protein AidB-like acyl-CoA dehydrogenase